MYLLSIVSATRDHRPGDGLLRSRRARRERALVEACKRGVKVQDDPARPAHRHRGAAAGVARANGAILLQAGVEIYEFQPTMFHCKVMVVDGFWASVGSTNFDNRSFRLNDEANLNVFSAEFAERQTAIFNEDLKRSRRVTYKAWSERPLWQKAVEQAEALIDSQL